jgi:phospholipase C
MVAEMKRSILAVALACACQKADWGFEAIRTMPTPPDPPMVCGVNPPVVVPQGCSILAGAHAGIDVSKVPIRHVIVMMKENRSFDHLFGKLHDRGQPGVEAIPSSYVNPDANGNPIAPMHAGSTCINADPGHQSESMIASINGGKMDGFVKNAAKTTTDPTTDGTFAISYYDDTDIPFNYWLAKTFAIADADFAPTSSGTFANRTFMMFGTNAGVVDTGILYPPPTTASIFQLLMNAGFTWAAYGDANANPGPGEPLSGALAWTADDPGVHPMSDLYDALAKGTLPNVAFVDGRESWEDDHPRADLQRGEAWTKKIYDLAVQSPQWPRLAILFTYDEGGGFFDHVPPPDGCQALPSNSPFTHRGVRIPLIAISPWAKRNYVSHIVRDHTAITRFIEALFDLPALTARDANSDALFDMFDFSDCTRADDRPMVQLLGKDGCKQENPPGTD